MKFHAIRENHLFVKAYKKGRRTTSADLTVFVLPDKHAYLLRRQNPQRRKINRIGISTPKSIGNAVERSRVRRIIRAGYCELLAKYDIKTGFLIVFSARVGSPASNSHAIFLQLEYAFGRLGMIRLKDPNREDDGGEFYD